jgi:DNA invertase Pin-like site-specific DNA recombinase
MVVALDRLGRSLRDLLHLLDDLTACGCAVVSLREAVDLSTPAGKMMTAMIGALAEFERTLIIDRVKSGMAKAKASGTRTGRPIGRPARAVDIAAVHRLRAEGRSWRQVAVALKVPVPTLRRAICRDERPVAGAAS